jgi:hypothetical protein
MRLTHLLFGLFLTFALTGCPARTITAQIKSPYERDLSLEFFMKNQWTGQREAQKFSSFSFVKVSPKGDVRTIVWSISSSERGGVELTELTYGRLPTGFTVLNALKKINRGEKIVVLYWFEKSNSTVVGSIETIIQ